MAPAVPPLCIPAWWQIQRETSTTCGDTEPGAASAQLGWSQESEVLAYCAAHSAHGVQCGSWLSQQKAVAVHIIGVAELAVAITLSEVVASGGPGFVGMMREKLYLPGNAPCAEALGMIAEMFEVFMHTRIAIRYPQAAELELHTL